MGLTGQRGHVVQRFLLRTTALRVDHLSTPHVLCKLENLTAHSMPPPVRQNVPQEYKHPSCAAKKGQQQKRRARRGETG
jgi:hypothetical protein